MRRIGMYFPCRSWWEKPPWYYIYPHPSVMVFKVKITILCITYVCIPQHVFIKLPIFLVIRSGDSGSSACRLHAHDIHSAKVSEVATFSGLSLRLIMVQRSTARALRHGWFNWWRDSYMCVWWPLVRLCNSALGYQPRSDQSSLSRGNRVNRRVRERGWQRDRKRWQGDGFLFLAERRCLS